MVVNCSEDRFEVAARAALESLCLPSTIKKRTCIWGSNVVKSYRSSSNLASHVTNATSDNAHDEVGPFVSSFSNSPPTSTKGS